VSDGEIDDPSLGCQYKVVAMPKKERDRTAVQVRRQFAVRLRAARETAGFATMAELARAIGQEPETYRRWERAETEPGLYWLWVLSDTTNHSLDWLIAGRSLFVHKVEEAAGTENPGPARRASVASVGRQR
jgi:ribosome-binding protein aMBF1 (putative translation factor)